jgi:hypothetical protein
MWGTIEEAVRNGQGGDIAGGRKAGDSRHGKERILRKEVGKQNGERWQVENWERIVLQVWRN